MFVPWPRGSFAISTWSIVLLLQRSNICRNTFTKDLTLEILFSTMKLGMKLLDSFKVVTVVLPWGYGDYWALT